MTNEVSRTEFAQLVERDTRTIQNWIDAGMPCRKRARRYVIDLATALPWVVQYLDSRSEKPGSERERLAKEQADKIALENEATRKNIVFVHHVQQVLEAAVVSLAAELEGVPGRLAKDLAGQRPAMIRQVIQDEHRQVRDNFARNLAKLFEPPAPGPDPGEVDEAPAKKKRSGVGRKKKSTAKRQRRTR